METGLSLDPVESGQSGEETQVETTQSTESTTKDTQSVEFNWKSHLDADYAADKTIASIPDNIEGLKQFGKMFVHSQKMIGQDKVVIPNSKSAPEDWNMFYDKIGRPADPAGYELSKVEMPQTFLTPDDPAQAKAFNDKMAESWAKKFHEAGVPAQQAKKLYTDFVSEIKGMTDGMNEKIASEVESRNQMLYKAWGAEGSPEFTQNRNIANRAYQQFASPEDAEYLEQSGLAYDPVLSMMFNKIGKAMLEDTTFTPDAKGTFSMTAEKASAKLKEIFADPTHPYFNRDNPTHKSAMDEVQRLFSAGGSL